MEGCFGRVHVHASLFPHASLILPYKTICMTNEGRAHQRQPSTDHTRPCAAAAAGPAQPSTDSIPAHPTCLVEAELRQALHTQLSRQRLQLISGGVKRGHGHALVLVLRKRVGVKRGPVSALSSSAVVPKEASVARLCLPCRQEAEHDMRLKIHAGSSLTQQELQHMPRTQQSVIAQSVEGRSIACHATV